MIVDINAGTLSSIRNSALRSYANIYVSIYQKFLDQISHFCVDIEAQDESQHLQERIAYLKGKGAGVRNDTHSVFVNCISPACQACQKGVDSLTFFISLKCHRDCFYCFNPNQENYAYYREHTRDTAAELGELRKSGQRMRHLALTGGEPLLHKEETIQFFQQARRSYPDVYTRLYTCGDHLERETLQAFKDAHMDEIRFSIRMHDLARGKRHTYDQISLAREYIPNVMVEMPVLPGTFEEMQEILVALDQLGIFGINLLEFCFPLTNGAEFQKRGYTIKARPYRILYNYWYAGGLPVAGSENVCLDLVEFALDARLKMGVHYCSLENKHTGQVYQQNVGRNFSRTLYFSQKDYFLKTAKVFGDDVPAVRKLFDKGNYTDYQLNPEHGYLEFHVRKIKDLKKLDIEIGISTNIVENRQDGLVLRELKLDVTTPQTFSMSADI